MRKWLVTAFVALVLSACNLDQAGVVTPQSSPTPTLPAAFRTATAPGPTALPALPTRTPIGGASEAASGGLILAPLPTSQTGESADISSPAAGAAVFTGTLQISGVVRGLTRDEFTLTIATLDGDSLNSQLIRLQNPNHVREVPWSAAMTLNAVGDAVIEIRARSAAGDDLLLARTPVTVRRAGSGSSGGNIIATGLPAASGPVASIDVPVSGQTIGGAILQVTGTAGGIAENAFTLSLIAPDGRTINSQIISLSGANLNNLVPWAAALGTNGVTGPVEIRASYDGKTLASSRITLQ